MYALSWIINSSPRDKASYDTHFQETDNFLAYLRSLNFTLFRAKLIEMLVLVLPFKTLFFVNLFIILFYLALCLYQFKNWLSYCLWRIVIFSCGCIVTRKFVEDRRGSQLKVGTISVKLNYVVELSMGVMKIGKLKICNRL